MSGRNVQCIEVVLFCFHLRAIEHGKAERREKIFNFILKLGDRVQAAGAHAGSRQRYIDPFLGQATSQIGFLETALLLLVLAFEILFNRVQQLADAGTLFRGELSELSGNLGKRPLAAQRLYSRFLQLVHRDCRSKTCEGSAAELFELSVQHHPCYCSFAPSSSSNRAIS